MDRATFVTAIVGVVAAAAAVQLPLLPVVVDVVALDQICPAATTCQLGAPVYALRVAAAGQAQG